MTDIHKMLEVEQSDEPVMNKALEDALAMSGYDARAREMTLGAWIQLGAEVLAREVGRERARQVIQNTDRFLRDAQPSTPWPK